MKTNNKKSYIKLIIDNTKKSIGTLDKKDLNLNKNKKTLADLHRLE